MIVTNAVMVLLKIMVRHVVDNVFHTKLRVMHLVHTQTVICVVASLGYNTEKMDMRTNVDV
jgi:hypothetical protein